MTTYVALIRGIGPGNPNMRSEKLKGAFEALGFNNVATVISSGNVVFDTSSKSDSKLEKKIEDGLEKQLGFKRAVIIRSKGELEKLTKKDPFKGIEDKKPNYLVVTFFKDRKEELCSVVNITAGTTSDFMRDLEKKYGKDITTRTWKTVGRILKVMK